MRRHRHRRGEAVVLPAGGDEPTRLRSSTSSSVLPAASVSAATLLAPFSIGVARLRSPSSPTGLTVRAYSTSGGACVVAKDNLGQGAALTNGQPLYLKWLLLLEPRVLLANVPFRLD